MDKIKLAFVNPPHADWCLPQTVTFLSMESHYNRVGKFRDSVEWLKPPYKWDQYENVQQVFEEIKDADIILFSSYVWNCSIVDELAVLVKEKLPNAITMIGGPHVGFNQPDFKSTRWMYDYVATPTTPGELFITDFLDLYIEAGTRPNPEDISFEARSCKKQKWEFLDFSLYEEHFDYLKEICDYADAHSMEKFTVIETTRGCPYKCAYCEWGGGLGTKIIKKQIDIVKRDILALKKAGYTDVYLADANFGVFEERDREILLFASKEGVKLSDISVVKAKNLNRRKRIVDLFYETGINWDVHIPIQSISENAMKVANRTDLSLKDKIELGKYIKKMADDHGYPRPGLEMIMAMPGSTLDEFYAEYELMLDFDALGDYRYDYMVLPDSEAASPKYIEEFDITLVDVYNDNIDEDNVLNKGTLYKSKPSYFKTMSKSFSYTNEEMCEMFVMNYAAPRLIEKFFDTFSKDVHISEFVSTCFEVLSELDSFQPIWEEVIDIFNPSTPPRNINVLCGRLRTDTMNDFIDMYSSLIFTGLFERIYLNDTTN